MGEVRGGGGKNREGNKRQGDNWGMPSHKEYQVYFISSKGRSSAQAGGMKEKRNVLISLLGQTSPLPVGYGGGPAAGPTFPQTRGTENPTFPGLSVDPCLPHAYLRPPSSNCPAGCAAGFSDRQEPPTWPMHVAWVPVCALLGGRVWRCLKGDSVLWLGPGALLSTSYNEE